MRVCVHTAIHGDYCQLLEPREPCKDVEMICHTDTWREHGAWRTAWDRGEASLSPRMQAKYHKMHPPLGYDVTIWVDASLQLGNVRRFVDYCLAALGDNSLAFFRHPQHSSIWEEAEASLTHHRNKYAPYADLIHDQIEAYREDGFPEKHDLYAGGVIVRRSSDRNLEYFNERWWIECNVWTPQDQLSLPYVLWVFNRTPAIIPGNVYQGLDWAWFRGPDK